MTLYEIRLPEGDVPGWDIDYASGTGNRKYSSSEWLSKGHEGVRFIGAGRGKTHVRPQLGSAWDTILFDRHPGRVQFEEMTIHCGKATAVRAGLAHPNMKADPRFACSFCGVDIIADEDVRGTWGLFGYQVDVDAYDVLFSCENLVEHASYWHGFSKYGLTWNCVTVEASGAEGCKVRNDPSEISFVRGAQINIMNSTFKNWYQPHSSRGGGGVVIQGSGAKLIFLHKCMFWAPLNGPSHTRCVMIDDNGDKGAYGVPGGSAFQGYPNGDILIEKCGFRAGRGTENLTDCIRVGSIGENRLRKTARSVKIHGCGIYGQGVKVGAEAPQGNFLIKGCNTPAIREWCHARGVDTEHEAVVATRDRTIPVSEGYRA